MSSARKGRGRHSCLPAPPPTHLVGLRLAVLLCGGERSRLALVPPISRATISTPLIFFRLS